MRGLVARALQLCSSPEFERQLCDVVVLLFVDIDRATSDIRHRKAEIRAQQRATGLRDSIEGYPAANPIRQAAPTAPVREAREVDEDVVAEDA